MRPHLTQLPRTRGFGLQAFEQLGRPGLASRQLTSMSFRRFACTPSTRLQLFLPAQPLQARVRRCFPSSLLRPLTNPPSFRRYQHSRMFQATPIDGPFTLGTWQTNNCFTNRKPKSSRGFTQLLLSLKHQVIQAKHAARLRLSIRASANDLQSRVSFLEVYDTE